MCPSGSSSTRAATKRRSAAVAIVLALLLAAVGVRAAGPARGGSASIAPAELQEWLTYIASDALEGRQVYTEGLGLAAAYIEDHLASWHVKPGGDSGTYFQTVKVLGVKTTSHSRVTVSINGQSRTFTDGDGVTFAKNQGSTRTVTGALEFIGYGVTLPTMHHDDFAGRNVAGRIVLFIGRGPQGITQADNRLIASRGRDAVELHGALAAIGPPRAGGAGRGGAGRPGGPQIDFETTQRLDHAIAPQIAATDDFYRFVFGAAGVDYDDLKGKADRLEPLPAVSLPNASITIEVNADYDVVRTRLTRNVVGIVEGRDQKLKDTYVLLGAHYDHIGYRPAPPPPNAPPVRDAGGCPGQTRDTPRAGDTIDNGADDDGSGTVALMALARAYALGPAPRRSLMFVWHTGEEAGLFGSRYMADYPEVPLDRVAAQLNIDMIGRNHCDDPAESNTVYIVGSDRISTELHNLNEDANRSLDPPLTLDYDLNDPSDPESVYTRSDHYSYAAKGIPIIFFTTGLHRDYHYLTDEVDRIDFPKLTRVTQLVYATAWRVANLDHFPARDNKGPRTGRGQSGKIIETR